MIARIAEITITKGHKNFDARIQMYDRCNTLSVFRLSISFSTHIRQRKHANPCHRCDPKRNPAIDLPIRLSVPRLHYNLNPPFRLKEKQILSSEEQINTTSHAVSLKYVKASANRFFQNHVRDVIDLLQRSQQPRQSHHLSAK